jgi:hypothetical protein
MEVRMQKVIQYLGMPDSFKKDIPMSVQLKAERLKLFPQNKKQKAEIARRNYSHEQVTKVLSFNKVESIETTAFYFINEACAFLDINFDDFNTKKANKYTGVNYDLYSLVYYLRSREVCKLSFMQQYIFIERNIYNYKRHIPDYINKKRYIDLFNYLDTLL